MADGATMTDQHGSPQQQAQALFRAALANHTATAVWRLPGQAAPAALVDLTGAYGPAPIDFRRPRQEFVFAPFINRPDNAALRLHADILLGADGIVAAAPARTLTRRVLADFARFLGDAAVPAPAWYLPPAAAPGDHAAAEDLHRHRARRHRLYPHDRTSPKSSSHARRGPPLPTGFDPATAFTTLCARYPHAFVSLVAIPGVGTWLGATPGSAAHAGRRRLDHDGAGRHAAPPRRPDRWRACRGAVKSRRAGDGQRLHSQLFCQRRRTSSRKRARTPSPPVRSYTCRPSSASICRRRRGWRLPIACSTNCTQLRRCAVCPNIRRWLSSWRTKATTAASTAASSARCTFRRIESLRQPALYAIGADHAHLYVGAGITADSDPAAEWRETALKAETMLAVLTPEAV
jgi:isochorismate synthase